MKVIGREEDSGRKPVPVSRGHRDKQFGKCVGSIPIQFDSGVKCGCENLVFLTNKALRVQTFSYLQNILMNLYFFISI